MDSINVRHSTVICSLLLANIVVVMYPPLPCTPLFVTRARVLSLLSDVRMLFMLMLTSDASVWSVDSSISLICEARGRARFGHPVSFVSSMKSIDFASTKWTELD